MIGKTTGTDKECGAIEDISVRLIFPLISNPERGSVGEGEIWQDS
jgi:hypothetical protein